ncbi:MAG: DinB family protein, partial [bacterium]
QTARESIDRYFAAGPMTTPPRWPGAARDAVATVTETLRSSRAYWSSLSEEDLETKLGPPARAMKVMTYATLLLHAVDELVHHSAEIGRMRDIYRALGCDHAAA